MAFSGKNKPDLSNPRHQPFPAFRKTGGLVKAHVVSSLKGILLAAVVLVAGSAFANENKGSMELQNPTNVAGKQLNKGSYNLRWEGTGDQVEVKIYQGKNLVASAPAKVLKVENPISTNSAVVNRNADGTSSLAEVRFGGKKYALQIVNDGGSASGGASR